MVQNGKTTIQFTKSQKSVIGRYRKQLMGRLGLSRINFSDVVLHAINKDIETPEPIIKNKAKDK